MAPQGSARPMNQRQSTRQAVTGGRASRTKNRSVHAGSEPQSSWTLVAWGYLCTAGLVCFQEAQLWARTRTPSGTAHPIPQRGTQT